MIQIPHGVELYDHQREALAEDREEGAPRFRIDRWHRGSGKGIKNVARVAIAAYEEPGAYVWVSPTIPEINRTVWDALDHKGRPYLDMIPAALIVDRNENDKVLTLRTKVAGAVSRIWFVSATDPDKLRGIHPRGAVLDEYAVHPEGDECYRVLLPAITRAKGWMAISSTPKGRSNHFATLCAMAKDSPDWRLSVKTIEDTHDETGAPLVTLEDVRRQEREGQHRAWLDQEYFVKFTAALVASYYGDLLTRMQAEGRLGEFPARNDLRAVVALDLGISNATVATWAQDLGGYVTLIDCEAWEGLDFTEIIRRVRAQGHDLGRWVLPHDVAQRQQTGASASGRAESRLDVARRLGVRPHVLPNQAVDEGIDAVRRLMASRLRIDTRRCAKLLEALEGYQKVWDPAAKVFKDRPKHDWTSDYADSLRYLCLGWKAEKTEAERARLPKTARIDYDVMTYNRPRRGHVQ